MRRHQSTRAFPWALPLVLLIWAAIARADEIYDIKLSGGNASLPKGASFTSDSDIVEGNGFVTSDRPFYFEIPLAEGNYDVTLTLGNPTTSADTTVKAQLRRLMLLNIHTDAGQSVTRTIVVNIRTPAIPGGAHVHLKPRESANEMWAWDGKLHLEFNGTHPSVERIQIAPTDVPTVYLLGDSTVCDQPLEPWNSWGQMLTYFLKPGVAVSNQAESGETADDSIRAKRLAKVLSTIKSGDYLFVQFGHNDMKEHGAGIGPFTSYTANLQQYIDGARAKGATPVLVTSVNRKAMDSSGHVLPTLKEYPDAVRQLAKQDGVALVDLNAISKTLYETIGPKDISKLFVDGTHHNAYGSYEMARCIVQGIINDKLDLAKFVEDDWQTFDPAHPDAFDSVKVPASPKFDKAAPAGS